MVNLRRGEVRNEWELAARRAVAATRRNVNNATAAARRDGEEVRDNDTGFNYVRLRTVLAISVITNPCL